MAILGVAKAVYGVDDPRGGERPRAAVVVMTGETLAEDEVLEFVRDRLASYKQLASVRFVDEIPRNAGGKVLRRVLKSTDDDA